MKPSRFLGLILAAGLAGPLFAADHPASELDQALRELESLVRSLHEVRRSSAAELEGSRAAAARSEAEARDLDREAGALEEEAGPLRESVARLEREHEQLAARHARIEKARADLGAASPQSWKPLVETARALRADAARARSTELDGESVRVGPLAVFPTGSEPGRSLADQLARRSSPALVKVSVKLEGLEKP